MNTQGWIILAFLVTTNATLLVSEIIRRRNRKTEMEKLRRRKDAGMAARTGAGSFESLGEDDLEDEIEPKQSHAWILGVVICLDIWILGAIFTHWWATTFFADYTTAKTISLQMEAENTAATSEVSKAATRGLFGDSFGAVNALVSALAFAGMIVAFVLQRYELRLQRKELRDNRSEMRCQTLQFETQNNNLKLQRFENTFFHMLELHKQNLQEIEVQGIKGREAIVMLLDQLKRLYLAVENATNELRAAPLVGLIGSAEPFETVRRWDSDSIKQFNIKFAYGLFFYGADYHVAHQYKDETRVVENAVHRIATDDIKDAYRLVMNSEKQGVSSYLGHYFRHMYQTVCFVDKQTLLNPEEKYAYVKMLRAQMSDYEQILFYYNAMSSMGKSWREIGADNLSLIIRYKLIKNVPHFYEYFFSEPYPQFKDEITAWRAQNPGEYFFEQITIN